MWAASWRPTFPHLSTSPSVWLSPICGAFRGPASPFCCDPTYVLWQTCSRHVFSPQISFSLFLPVSLISVYEMTFRALTVWLFCMRRSCKIHFSSSQGSHSQVQSSCLQQIRKTIWELCPAATVTVFEDLVSLYWWSSKHWQLSSSVVFEIKILFKYVKLDSD